MKDNQLAGNSAEAFKMWHIDVKGLLVEFSRKRLVCATLSQELSAIFCLLLQTAMDGN